MKILYILIFSISISFFSFAQSKKRTFTQFEITIPLKGNPNNNEVYPDGRSNKTWFLPDGLSAKFGFGFHQNKWIALGIHTGVDWKATEKLVAIPIYGNLKLSPKVGDEIRLFAQIGYGKSFAIGRGNLSGAYRKLSLGLQDSNDVAIFIEIAEHQLAFNNYPKINTVSVGICLTTF
jgi:hypothetical protein